MKLQEAINLVKLNPNLDILTTIGIKVFDEYDIDKVYGEKISSLPSANYFISDLDGTFFRGVLVQEAFTLFAKYVRNLDIRTLDIERYKEFLDDYSYFLSLENATYNKQIEFIDYLFAGMFLLYKYYDFVDWEAFLNYLRENFYLKQKVNPFKFSFSKMAEVLLNGDNFMFVSGASSFVFDIYLELLKKFIKEHLGEKYVGQVYGFSSLVDFNKKEVYNLRQNKHKDNFIKFLKNKGKIIEIVGGMGDTCADFGIADNVEKGKDFYFINPERAVIEKFDNEKKEMVNYHFIIERKNLIFEFRPGDIELLGS